MAQGKTDQVSRTSLWYLWQRYLERGVQALFRGATEWAAPRSLQPKEHRMTTEDFITELFCGVDEEMKTVPKDSQASLWPSEVLTLGLLFALKGVGNRAFYRSPVKILTVMSTFVRPIGSCEIGRLGGIRCALPMRRV